MGIGTDKLASRQHATVTASAFISWDFSLACAGSRLLSTVVRHNSCHLPRFARLDTALVSQMKKDDWSA